MLAGCLILSPSGSRHVYCCSGRRGCTGARPSSSFVPASANLGRKCLDFVRGFDVQENIETALGDLPRALNLVNFMGLELGKNIAEVNQPVLISCLQLFKRRRRPRFPLPRCLGQRKLCLVGTLCFLVLGLVRLLLRRVQSF